MGGSECRATLVVHGGFKERGEIRKGFTMGQIVAMR